MNESKYTKQQYKDMAKVLKLAEKYLALKYEDAWANTKYKNICAALSEVVKDYRQTSSYANFSAVNNLHVLIIERLEPYAYYPSWVEGLPDTPYLDYRQDEVFEKMQYSRLNWMRNMQEEFLAKAAKM